MKVGKNMPMITFDAKEKKILSEELNKLMVDYLDLLEEYDDDEEARERLFTICYLKNLITTNKIDSLSWSQDDDSIFSVNLD